MVKGHLTGCGLHDHAFALLIFAEFFVCLFVCLLLPLLFWGGGGGGGSCLLLLVKHCGKRTVNQRDEPLLLNTLSDLFIVAHYTSQVYIHHT